MTRPDLSAGLCFEDDPRQWNGPGTPYAHYVCGLCKVFESCRADALATECDQDGMRAGIWFDDGKRRDIKGRAW